VHGAGGLADDLKVLESEGKAVWDGAEEISVREATPFEYNQWQANRARTIEPDLDDEDGLVHLLFLIPIYDPTDES
jgi:hypothetical protein